ncbi:hypothetical protein HYU13_06770 [Candidatus Woesearchaeota archaeon]|nr:hypothetical protein [Candidatus Woesearchaeota archaeon]
MWAILNEIDSLLKRPGWSKEAEKDIIAIYNSLLDELRNDVKLVDDGVKKSGDKSRIIQWQYFIKRFRVLTYDNIGVE